MKLQYTRSAWYVHYTEGDTPVRLHLDIYRGMKGDPVPVTFKRPGEVTAMQAGLITRNNGTFELTDPVSGIFRLDAMPMEIEIGEQYLNEGPLAETIGFRVPMVDSRGNLMEQRRLRFPEAKALMLYHTVPDNAIGFMIHRPGAGQAVNYVSVAQRAFTANGVQYRALYTGDQVWSETEIEVLPVLPNDTKDIYLNQADMGGKEM